MMSPKRQRHYFLTLEGAEGFAAQIQAGGARDVVVVPAVNVEDYVRGYENPRVNGASVCWTEDTTD
jgi:hypothetical protein